MSDTSSHSRTLVFVRVWLSCLWFILIILLYILNAHNSFKPESVNEVALTFETRNLMELEPNMDTQHDEDSRNEVFGTDNSKVYMANIMDHGDSVYHDLECDYSKTSPIHVLFSLDSKYKYSFNALINSIIQNSCNVSRLHFHILLDYQKRKDIKKFVKKFERLFVRKPVQFKYEFKSPYIEYPQFMESFQYFKRAIDHRFIRPSIFFRFYLADIFRNVDVGIYLDSDVIVQTDIAHLIDDNDINMEYPLYVVLTMNPKTLNTGDLVTNSRKKEKFIRTLKPMMEKYNLSEGRIRNVLDVKTKTFNNGVMVLNMDYWRGNKLTEQAEYLVKMDRETQRRFLKIGNQQLYNLLFLMNDCNIGSLDNYWNVWGLARSEWCNDAYLTPKMRSILDKGYILHYAANKCKPWFQRSKNLTVAKYFWKYWVYYQ